MLMYFNKLTNFSGMQINVINDLLQNHIEIILIDGGQGEKLEKKKRKEGRKYYYNFLL